ncbi:hypothetical protein RSOLAG1IB_10159 [Rhizoctonia solani AG-1 IB]|uniref:Uncharacterized protein n=1 Tax=Thanatephorus cucumeris (strain AG1-IB / isolate 7/3/14) TaxID=1108050 RepID=A0A0B7FVS6_THACB|nr:hypothetical protein RSOLAG1IB_10159 [Rhizoctonia solani AG-1 IB]
MLSIFVQSLDLCSSILGTCLRESGECPYWEVSGASVITKYPVTAGLFSPHMQTTTTHSSSSHRYSHAIFICVLKVRLVPL